MNPKISVIIPVYNVEKYLRQCLDSVANQTYRNLEIICVDDGSPDNCGKILDEYAEKDDRFVVIHQENGGLSVARNAGLDVAIGEYILFVDSDDWIALTTCETALSVISNEIADVVMWQYLRTDGTLSMDIVPKSAGKIYKTLYEKLFLSEKSNRTAWTKLYKREFIEKYKLRFIPHIYFEDNPFSMDVAYYANKIVFIDKPFYFYRTGGGITGKKNDRKFFNIIPLATNIVNDLKKRGVSKEALPVLYAYKFNFIYAGFRNMSDSILMREYESEIQTSFSDDDWKFCRAFNINIWPRARAFYQYLYQKQRGNIVMSQILKFRWFVYMLLFKFQDIFQNWKYLHFH